MRVVVTRMKNDEEERRKPFRAGDCGHGAAG